MPKKLNYKFVKDYIESFDNYKLLDSKYKNNSTKMKIKCSNNHIIEMNFSNFQQGRRCSICAGNSKYSIDYVKDFINSFNYKCLSDQYINNISKLKIQCSNGHIFFMNFSNFKRGKRCNLCYFNILKHDIKYIKQFLKNNNYELLSNEYINCKNKLKLKCPNNHIFKMRWNNFQSGQRCPTCSYYNSIGSNNHNWNPNREDIKLLNRIRKKFKKNWIIENMKHDNNYNNFLKNYNKYHLDHIIPIKAFCDVILAKNLNEEKIKDIANHIRNLQLILKEENLNKGFSYNKYEIDKYINLYYN